MKQSRANTTSRRSIDVTPEGAAGERRRITSHSLFQGGTEITIVHQDEEYRLRITRNGRLILTK